MDYYEKSSMGEKCLAYATNWCFLD